MRVHFIAEYFFAHESYPSKMTAPVDLSNIVLILGNIQHITETAESPAHVDEESEFGLFKEILQLSENRRFEFTPPEDEKGWRGDQESVDLHGPFLCLSFGLNMFSPGGWVCGSGLEDDDCDLRLAKDNRAGVGRRHFRIDINPLKHRPRVTNIARRNLILIYGDNRPEPIRLYPDEHVDIDSPVTFDLGPVRFRAWRPTLSNDQSLRYNKNAELFHQDYMRAIPRSAESTLAQTLDIRFGLSSNNAYRREGPDVGRGAFASVMKVRALSSGKFYAAKVPHFKSSDAPGKIRNRWESLSGELQKLTRLNHVSDQKKWCLWFSTNLDIGSYSASY